MIPEFRMITPPTFTVNDKTYKYETDFVQFFGSGSGNVAAKSQLIQNLGCTKDDFKDFTAGNIALVKRGNFQLINIKRNLHLHIKSSKCNGCKSSWIYFN
jgi:hypothetical protein